MSTELIINASLPEIRIALLEEGKIQELLIERASEKGIVGNIYKGRVTRVLPGMQAAFVDVGLEKAAFLYVDDVFLHPDEVKESIEVTNDGDSEMIASDLDEEEVEGLESVEASETAESKSEDEEGSGDGDIDAQPEGAPEALLSDESDESSEASGEPEEEGGSLSSSSSLASEANPLDEEAVEDVESETDEEEEDRTSYDMGAPEDGSDVGGSDEEKNDFEGTVTQQEEAPQRDESETQEAGQEQVAADGAGGQTSSNERESGAAYPNRSGRRGRGDRYSRSHHRGGRGRRGSGTRGRRPSGGSRGGAQSELNEEYASHVNDRGDLESDRAVLASSEEALEEANQNAARSSVMVNPRSRRSNRRSEFRQHRSKDRRIRSRTSTRSPRRSVNIQDLLKEGQEVIVQVAKDPIASKGARLTCHVSLPGRHLVCMPTIDHIGVSRRIENDGERRALRDYVETERQGNMGFIVRTASGGKDPRRWIKQDIDYLKSLWAEILEKASDASAPALIYEDLNSVVRSVRDWVSEEVVKIYVDSRYYYNQIQDFVERFMPFLRDKTELYHGDIPIFDAYGISTELHRALERRVWLKSGGYIVIDQAEALVAIDINTGRFVGKKNLEDTILKTNVEAVEEIAYQLRLRNCGGIIIIDLIDMEREESKHRVVRALENALQRDRARPTIVRMSEIGLIEMTRKRTRDTMVRALCHSCNFCEGKGFIKSKETVAYEVLREVERESVGREVKKILVQANPDVIDILAIDHQGTLSSMEKRYRKEILLQAVTDFHPEQFEVTVDRNERKSANYTSSSRQSARGNARSRQRPGRTRRGGRGGSTGTRRGNVSPQVERANTSMEEKKLEAAESTSEGADDPNEEDRLAFLRAQAAQDAALADLESGSSSTTSRTTSRTSNYRSGNGRATPNNARKRKSTRGGRGSSRGGHARGNGPSRGPGVRGRSTRGSSYRSGGRAQSTRPNDSTPVTDDSSSGSSSSDPGNRSEPSSI